MSVLRKYAVQRLISNSQWVSFTLLVSMGLVFFFFLFLKIFLADTYTYSIWGPLIPLFWISGNVSSGFQSQSGLPYLHWGGKRNVHSLRSNSGATHCQPLDGNHCRVPTRLISCPRILLAPVRLEPTIKRSWVLRANHSATHPGHRISFLQKNP